MSDKRQIETIFQSIREPFSVIPIVIIIKKSDAKLHRSLSFCFIKAQCFDTPGRNG